MTILTDDFSEWVKESFSLLEDFDSFNLPDPIGSVVVKEYVCANLLPKIAAGLYVNSPYPDIETHSSALEDVLSEPQLVRCQIDSDNVDYGVVGIVSKDKYSSVSKLTIHDLDSTGEIILHKSYGLDTTNSFDDSLKGSKNERIWYYNYDGANTYIEAKPNWHSVNLYGLNNTEVYECQMINRTTIENDGNDFCVSVNSNLSSSPNVFADMGELYCSGLAITNNMNTYFIGYTVNNVRRNKVEEIIWTNGRTVFRRSAINNTSFRIRRDGDLILGEYWNSSIWEQIGAPFSISDSVYNWLSYISGVVSASAYGSMVADFTNFRLSYGNLFRDGGGYPVIEGDGQISDFAFADSTTRLNVGYLLTSTRDRDSVEIEIPSISTLLIGVGLFGDKLTVL